MSQMLFAIVFGFLAGVAAASLIGSVFQINETSFIIGATGLVVGASLCVIKKYHRMAWVVFFIAAILFGMVRMHHVVNQNNHTDFQYLVEESVFVQGTIVRDPDVRIDNQKITIEVDAIGKDRDTMKNAQDVELIITTDRYALFSYGDLVLIEGRLGQPENFVTDTGREFDYRSYLAKDSIFYQMFYPEIETLGHGYGGRITAWMLSLKNVFVRSIDRMFVQPEGALLAGELFGEKSALGGSLQTAFRRTGVIHIVVLSGFNITIVAIFMIWLLERLLHPRIALFFGIAGIALFAMLVGGGATVIRDSVMAVLAIIARMVGRDYDVTRALFLAAFVMVLVNPRILIFDISFQLSFLATLSLIYISPIIEQKMGWVTTHFQLRETLVQTLSAQVFVLPLLLYSIGEFSVVSVLVNALVVPLVPLTMLFGFVTAVIGIVVPFLAYIPLVPSYLLLKAQLLIVNWFNELSFAAVRIPPIPWWVVVLLYCIVGVWIYRQYKNKKYNEITESSSQLSKRV